jgi:Glycosyl transferases group 1
VNKKMKVAYIASLDPKRHSGVLKKIRAQVSTWNELGYEAKSYFIVLNENDVVQFDNENVYLRRSLEYCNKELFRDLEEFSPDLLYLRSELYKPYILKLLKKYKTVLEINSDEIGELKRLAKTNLKNKIRFLYFLATKNLILTKVAGIVCVTHEISNLSYLAKVKKKFVAPNSINLNDYNIISKKRIKNKVQIFIMGNMNQAWIGLDHIIRLAMLTEDELHFHVVGLKPSEEINIKNITFYGFLAKEGYQQIIANCNIGLGPLAFYKNGMNEACSLKIREYLAYGLPIIISHNDTMFHNKIKPEWVLQLPNHANNLNDNLFEILEFCEKYKNFIVSHHESRKYVSVDLIEQDKLKFLERLVK